MARDIQTKNTTHQIISTIDIAIFLGKGIARFIALISFALPDLMINDKLIIYTVFVLKKIKFSLFAMVRHRDSHHF
jgi:hypothetical protein